MSGSSGFVELKNGARLVAEFAEWQVMGKRESWTVKVLGGGTMDEFLLVHGPKPLRISLEIDPKVRGRLEAIVAVISTDPLIFRGEQPMETVD